MSRSQTITFRCREDLSDRLDGFAEKHGIDRTSAIKLALHYYLNKQLAGAPQDGLADKG